MVTRNVGPNTPLTAQNLAVKNNPAEAVPAGSLAAIPAGKVAGQRRWVSVYSQVRLPVRPVFSGLFTTVSVPVAITTYVPDGLP